MTTNITIPSCRSGTDKASPSSWADAVKGRMKFQIVGMSPICRRTLVARWVEQRARSSLHCAPPPAWQLSWCCKRMNYQIVWMSPICRGTLVARWARSSSQFFTLCSAQASSCSFRYPHSSQVLQYASCRKHFQHFYFGRDHAYKLWTRLDLERWNVQ